MRLVDRKTFLSMPKGTVFMKKSRVYFGLDIPCVLEWTSENDYGYTQLNGFMGSDDFLDDLIAIEKGAEIEMRLAEERDGMYDREEQYYILLKSEIQEMIDILTKAIRL